MTSVIPERDASIDAGLLQDIDEIVLAQEAWRHRGEHARDQEQSG
jgi:hypothetical protein